MDASSEVHLRMHGGGGGVCEIKQTHLVTGHP